MNHGFITSWFVKVMNISYTYTADVINIEERNYVNKYVSRKKDIMERDVVYTDRSNSELLSALQIHT